MIVQRSIVEEASGPRSLLAIEMNKDTLLSQFCHSMNVKEAQRKVSNEFQFGEKCSLPGSSEYYPVEKHICFQVWNAGNKLV